MKRRFFMTPNFVLTFHSFPLDGRRRAHPEVVGNGARRLRRFNPSTPLGSGNFSIVPIQTPKRAEARAPTNNLETRGTSPGPRLNP